MKIVSPERVEYEGNATQVVVPGASGMFEILQNHAPIISTLEKGDVTYKDSLGTHSLAISAGFVEVQKNIVNVCVEL